MTDGQLHLWSVRDPAARRSGGQIITVDCVVVAFDGAQAIRLVSDVERRLSEQVEAQRFSPNAMLNGRRAQDIINRQGMIGIVDPDWYR